MDKSSKIKALEELLSQLIIYHDLAKAPISQNPWHADGDHLRDVVLRMSKRIETCRQSLNYLKNLPSD